MGNFLLTTMALMAMIILLCNGKDVCVKHGILKPINRIRIKDLRSTRVALDVTNFDSYLSQIDSDIPKFLNNLNSVSSTDNIDNLLTRNDVLYPFNGYYNAILLNIE